MIQPAETRPTVSIIMPTLNAGLLLDNCLASVAAQNCPRDRVEIILADACSRDDTRAIAARYGATVLDDHGMRCGLCKMTGNDARGNIDKATR